MDLKLLGAAPSAEEKAAIDAALEPLSKRGATGVHAKRHLLLPALEAAQLRVGWLSEGALNYICTILDVPPAEAYGVATFYALLTTNPRPPRVLHVCEDVACMPRGANAILAQLEKENGAPGHHGPEGNHVVIGADDAIWLKSPCLGLCDQAPAAFLQVAAKSPSSICSATLQWKRYVRRLAARSTWRALPARRFRNAAIR